ncbi:ECs_2282 family putative zinc-binding protein [Kangiella shandongensis]|uniref:ECs_2282 family putative zinc-binding protein n=1 Tax=Kangiella shandongensis TaxID=2763258 RepID=UPI001CBD2C00|nr:hypothetical protein [Kangiella shandongensis]
MNSEKYNRNVRLVCSTCGGTDFSSEEGVNDAVGLIVCTSCEREFTKDDLVKENSENINVQLSEAKKEIKKDIADDFKKKLRKAFSGNKNIKVK